MLFILLGGLLSTAMLAINLFVPKYIIDHINTSPLEELIFYAILLIFANLLFTKLLGLIQERVNTHWSLQTNRMKY